MYNRYITEKCRSSIVHLSLFFSFFSSNNMGKDTNKNLINNNGLTRLYSPWQLDDNETVAKKTQRKFGLFDNFIVSIVYIYITKKKKELILTTSIVFHG
jgi:hypothetical protein